VGRRREPGEDHAEEVVFEDERQAEQARRRQPVRERGRQPAGAISVGRAPGAEAGQVDGRRDLEALAGPPAAAA